MNGQDTAVTAPPIKPDPHDFDTTLSHNQIEQARIFYKVMSSKKFGIDGKANILNLMGKMLVQEAEDMDDGETS